jgi:hypothetical protein
MDNDLASGDVTSAGRKDEWIGEVCSRDWRCFQHCSDRTCRSLHERRTSQRTMVFRLWRSENLIYKFDFKDVRFIFLWSGKYDYRSPSMWDADRPKYAEQGAADAAVAGRGQGQRHPQDLPHLPLPGIRPGALRPHPLRPPSNKSFTPSTSYISVMTVMNNILGFGP